MFVYSAVQKGCDPSLSPFLLGGCSLLWRGARTLAPCKSTRTRSSTTATFSMICPSLHMNPLRTHPNPNILGLSRNNPINTAPKCQQVVANLWTDQIDNFYSMIYSTTFRADNLYDVYDLAHVAGWEPYNLHALLLLWGRFPGSGICTIQILHKISKRPVRLQKI